MRILLHRNYRAVELGRISWDHGCPAGQPPTFL